MFPPGDGSEDDSDEMRREDVNYLRGVLRDDGVLQRVARDDEEDASAVQAARARLRAALCEATSKQAITEATQMLTQLHPATARVLLGSGDWTLFAQECRMMGTPEPVDESFVLGAPTLGGVDEVSGGGPFRQPTMVLLNAPTLGVRARYEAVASKRKHATRLMASNALTPPKRGRQTLSRLHAFLDSAYHGAISTSSTSREKALLDACADLSEVHVRETSKDGGSYSVSATTDGEIVNILDVVCAFSSGRVGDRFFTTSLGMALGIPLADREVRGCCAMHLEWLKPPGLLTQSELRATAVALLTVMRSARVAGSRAVVIECRHHQRADDAVVERLLSQVLKCVHVSNFGRPRAFCDLDADDALVVLVGTTTADALFFRPMPASDQMQELCASCAMLDVDWPLTRLKARA